MSKTITLKHTNGTINLVFGFDVGLWIHPKDAMLKKIARDMYVEVQRRTHHNRDAMCYEKTWRKSIDRIKLKYNLEEESFIWQEMSQNMKARESSPLL